MIRRLLFKQFVLLAFLLGSVDRGPAQNIKRQTAVQTVDQANVTYRGGMVSPPLPKPKFTLADTSGAPFDLVSKTQGYTTLLFFGYTNCPDMCPMQMHMIAQAIKALPPGIASQFKVVFVTTDPERDNSQVLRTYLDHFDKSFIGLTGRQAAIDAAQIAANITPAEKTAVRPDGSYGVGHAAFVLAYTKDNLAHVIYPMGVTADDLAHDLPYLANEKWGRRAP